MEKGNKGNTFHIFSLLEGTKFHFLIGIVFSRYIYDKGFSITYTQDATRLGVYELSID